jgi:hypothetical protein
MMKKKIGVGIENKPRHPTQNPVGATLRVVRNNGIAENAAYNEEEGEWEWEWEREGTRKEPARFEAVRLA